MRPFALKNAQLSAAFLLCAGFLAMQPGTAAAAPTTYKVSFDSATGADASGSFVWDAATQQMSSFSWAFPEGTDTFSDAGLAKKIYSPGSARSVGALFFNLFTDPLAYWPSTNGLMSFSGGYFTTNFSASADISGSYPADMISFGYAKGASSASYEVLAIRNGRNVLDSGRITATAVPEPETLALLLAGLGVIGGLQLRRSKKQG